MEAFDLLHGSVWRFQCPDVERPAGMHPEVDWPTGNGGRIRARHAAVREYWTTQWRSIDPHVEAAPASPSTMAGASSWMSTGRCETCRVASSPIALVQHVYRIENGRSDTWR